MAASPAGALAAVERRIGLTATGLAAIVLAIAGWFAAHHFGGRALYLFVYTAAVIVLVAVYLARRRRPVRAERSELAHRARVGQHLDVEITLTSSTRVT